MKQNKTEIPEDTFEVVLKGGNSFEAVDSVDITAILDDGSVKMSYVFKCWEPDFEFYYLTTVDADNVDYIEETYTDENWDQLVALASVDHEEDATGTDVIFG